MRKKKALEKKHASASASSPVSSSCQSSLSSNNHVVDSHASKESFYDTGGYDDMMMGLIGGEKGYSMDDIWKDIDNMSEENNTPPSWDQYNISSQPLWVMDEEESNKMLFPTLSDQYFSHYEQGNEFLTG